MGKSGHSLDEKTRQKVLTGTTIAKYVFSVVLICMAGSMHGKRYMLSGGLELLIFFALSNLIVRNHISIGRIVNCILLFFLNIQMILLTLGGSYLSMLMLGNTDSWQDLAGNFGKYVVWIVLFLIGTFLPITEIRIRHVNSWTVLSCGLAGELIFVMALGNVYSPYYAYADLAEQKVASDKQKKAIAAMGDQSGRFNSGEVLSYRNKPGNLAAEKPNVILIMTEGLSQSIVEDERNLMPNVASYEGKSVNFTNYYNHTFATYRGIIGQLYSGYQNDNYDENHLVSLQSMLKDQGYHTTFINTEPNNAAFTSYLESMGFDEVTGERGLGRYANHHDYMSDREAYEALYDTAENQYKTGQPFLTVIYTFCTHISLGSDDAVYGDGKSNELNKFYNADVQFGDFMEKFEQSDMADNTLVVFTADHSTYTDQAWYDAFPKAQRPYSDIDRVPLFLYYRGIQPETIDAEGRNSLDLTPTILDYLDVSGHNNFLGMTLFSPPNNNNEFETVFCDPAYEVSTADGQLKELEGSQKEIFDENLQAYFARKLQ